MKENPSYYAIIPASIRYNPNLSMSSKMLYGEITALCNKEGFCWASNEYFAKLYGVHKNTVSKWINDLIKEGFLTSEVSNNYERKIYLSEIIEPPKRKAETPSTKS